MAIRRLISRERKVELNHVLFCLAGNSSQGFSKPLIILYKTVRWAVLMTFSASDSVVMHLWLRTALLTQSGILHVNQGSREPGLLSFMNPAMNLSTCIASNHVSESLLLFPEHRKPVCTQCFIASFTLYYPNWIFFSFKVKKIKIKKV